MTKTKVVNNEVVELTAEDEKEIEEQTKRSIEKAKTLYKEKRRFAYPEIGDEIARLEKEESDNEYKDKRAVAYPPIGDQLDDLFKQGAFSKEMSDKLQQVKTDHPKPE